MSDTLSIIEQELICLRRQINNLLDVVRHEKGLEVREHEQTIAPKLSKREQRIKYYSELLTPGSKRKNVKRS